MVNGRFPAAASPAGAQGHPKLRFCDRPLQRVALESNAGEIRIIQILEKSAAHLS
jgi:hypothetical protein